MDELEGFSEDLIDAVKRRTSCVYADLRELISEMELRKAA